MNRWRAAPLPPWFRSSDVTSFAKFGSCFFFFGPSTRPGASFRVLLPRASCVQLLRHSSPEHHKKVCWVSKRGEGALWHTGGGSGSIFMLLRAAGLYAFSIRMHTYSAYGGQTVGGGVRGCGYVVRRQRVVFFWNFFFLIYIYFFITKTLKRLRHKVISSTLAQKNRA